MAATGKRKQADVQRKRGGGEKQAPKVRTEDRHYGDEVQTYKVRCAKTDAFYLFVEAHNSDEAEFLAENYCREHDKEEDCFWESEASYQHSTFEAEET